MPIYVFSIEDSRAAGWLAEVALASESRNAAYQHLRSYGLHKKQFTLGIERVAHPGEVTEPAPGQLLRRRAEDDGWTDWTPVTDADPLNWKDDPSSP